jgi:hypothetical protein
MKDTVYIPEQAHRLMVDPRVALVLHHNHPNSYSLSETDLSKLRYPGVYRTTAHGHDGSTFHAMRGDFQPFEAVYAAAGNAMKEQIKLRRLDISSEANHLINAALGRAGIIQYDFSLAKSRLAIYNKNAVLFDLLIEETVAAIIRMRP